MPSPKESRIEDFAYPFLQSYYSNKYKGKNVYVFKAIKTKQGTEVDGLFAFLSPENKICTASLNTSYSTEIASMLNNYKKNGLSKTRYITAVITAAISFLLLFQIAGIFIAAGAALVVAATCFLIHSLLEKKFKVNKLRKIVSSFKQVPADEKWVGLSMSSLNFRRNRLAENFLALCRKNGIGVITVGQRAKVVLKQEPQQVPCPAEDFLTYYESETVIRTAVLTNKVLKVA
ncbi:hypothetical protein [Pontibacter harenae]|uniref:hypothetical protein n=1 Tax=Pontibacter harenae TaxID=2894083 RepID=UPI001E55C001|nr:hypothetical protein [Pontibacter harenae]MCC9167645.1 hypothetical protein [Pontibacter harenae]